MLSAKKQQRDCHENGCQPVPITIGIVEGYRLIDNIAAGLPARHAGSIW
jgi:hypothetical protein